MADHILIRMKRPDGRVVTVRVPEEHLQRVFDLACGEFGDKSIDLGGPTLTKPKGK